MATIGALIVELRSNSAQFRAEMDGARKGIKDVGTHAVLSGQQLARFGAIAAEHVVPGLQGSRVAMEQVIQKAIAMRGAIAALSLAGIGVGTALAVVVGVLGGAALGLGLNRFRELRKEGGSFLETLQRTIGYTAAYEERLKNEAEARRKVAETIERQRDLMRDLDSQLAKASGNEEEALRLAIEKRDEMIRKTFELNFQEGALRKSRQLAAQEYAALLTKQRADRDKYDQDVIAAMLKERAEQVKTWEDETRALQDQLRKRLTARQQFDAQKGQGAAALGIEDSATIGLKRAAEIRENARKALRDLFDDERSGRITPRDAIAERQKIIDATIRQLEALKTEFASVPPVVDAINTSLVSVQTGTFAIEMEKAREFVQKFIDTDEQLLARQRAVDQQFLNAPAAVDRASQAYQQFRADAIDLAEALYAVNTQLQNQRQLTSS